MENFNIQDITNSKESEEFFESFHQMYRKLFKQTHNNNTMKIIINTKTEEIMIEKENKQKAEFLGLLGAKECLGTNFDKEYLCTFKDESTRKLYKSKNAINWVNHLKRGDEIFEYTVMEKGKDEKGRYWLLEKLT